MQRDFEITSQRMMLEVSSINTGYELGEVFGELSTSMKVCMSSPFRVSPGITRLVCCAFSASQVDVGISVYLVVSV